MADARYVGRYEIRDKLGQGGMASVYRAYDTQFEREVAVKLLPMQLRHDPEFRIRFEREAKAIAGLEHPAIVPVYDFGEDDGQVFLVMRLMDGGSLQGRIDQGAISAKETGRILGRIAAAIDFAHQKGIVHRDVKPGNILFDVHDEPYLTDFGIVKLMGNKGTAVTVTGGMIGTPGYMSPEQARGESDIDGRSDIYSLGAVCFEMLTGELPFQADSAMSMAFLHISEPVPSLAKFNLGLDAQYDGVIAKVMAKEKGYRYESASKFAAVFSAVATGVQLPPGDMYQGPKIVGAGSGKVGSSGLSRRAKNTLGVVLVALVLAILVGLLMLRGQKADAPVSTLTTLSEEEIVTEIVQVIATPLNTATSAPPASSTPAPTGTIPPTASVTLQPSATPELSQTPITLAAPKVSVLRPTQQQLAITDNLWDTAVYRDLEQPGSRLYSVPVGANEDWIWGFSWCAVNAATLIEILEPLTIDYFIDGELLPLSEMLIFDETDVSGWRCRRWRVLLRDWLPGETVELGVIYSLSGNIYDGRTSYPAGDYEQLIFVTAN